MELREQLHHLIEALPENVLEDAAELLVSLQQPTTAKPPLQVADLGWTPIRQASANLREMTNLTPVKLWTLFTVRQMGEWSCICGAPLFCHCEQSEAIFVFEHRDCLVAFSSSQ